MKITNELRRIIFRNVKEKACRDAKAENDRRIKLARDTEKMIRDSDEYKAFLSAAEAVNKKAEEVAKQAEGIEVEDIVNMKMLRHCAFTRSVTVYSGDLCDDMCDRIILELSCGKDLDSAKEVLKKYGIEL